MSTIFRSPFAQGWGDLYSPSLTLAAHSFCIFRETKRRIKRFTGLGCGRFSYFDSFRGQARSRHGKEDG